MLHGKKNVFVDGSDDGGNDMEAEAHAWAANCLVPRANWRRFVQLGVYTRDAVLQFAQEQGIAPGIVVGSLQHEGMLPWSHLNHLNVRLRWPDGS